MTLQGQRAWAVPKWAAQTSHGRKSSSGEVSFCLLSGPGSGLVVAAGGVQAAVEDAEEPVGQGAQSLVVGGTAGAVGVVVGAGARGGRQCAEGLAWIFHWGDGLVLWTTALSF